MKRSVTGIILFFIIILSLVAVSCKQETSTTTTISTTSAIVTSTAISTIEKTSTTNDVYTTQSTSSQTVVAKWWDKFGEPEYGGESTLPIPSMKAVFDPYAFMGMESSFQYEPLFYPDWTVDRDIWSMQDTFVPEKYFSGHLVESWEMTDSQTFTVHLRQGIHWQNKEPVNGREFTSEDVVFHYDRMLGTGHGYTERNPVTLSVLALVEQVNAIDKYTVVFHFEKPCSGVAFFTVSDQGQVNWFEAPEWVALGGDGPVTNQAGTQLTDWKNTVGTGPWMLSDFVSNSSMTYAKNPDYWGSDPRYPENQTPYLNSLTLLVISDKSTLMAALRTGKVDIMGSYKYFAIGWQQAETLKDTDLKRIQKTAGSYGINFRLDNEPFTDIRVRKALNMAIDRKEIAQSMYGGAIKGIPTGIVTQNFKGWCYAYEDWPAELKEEYNYNPEMAKELLSEAGYPNGFETNTVVIDPDPLFEVFKSYFHDIGVEMEIRVMDFITFMPFVREGKHDQMAWTLAGYTYPPTQIIDAYYSKGMGSGQTHVNDAVYDSIRDEFWSSLTQEEAQAKLVEADKRVVEQHYGVWVIQDPGYIFYQPYLKGYSGEIRPNSSSQIFLSRLWVDSALKKSKGR